MPTVIEIRQALVDRGYVPIPVVGKAPPFSKWQQVENVTTKMLEGWRRNWPSATNTGVLTKTTPTLDIDILNEPAAVAVEELVRDRFGEHGCILVRIGNAPKRAIPFCVRGAPFSKITVNLIAANGATGEKIEFLGDGQQVVAAGIHPDTLKPYVWPLGNLTEIAHGDLPEIDEAEARALVEDAVELVCVDFGYARAAARPPRKSNGAHVNPAGDWQHLVNAILAGTDIHANTRDLAAKMVRAGTDGGAVVNFLRGLLNSSSAPRDDRWQKRFDNLPNLVAGFEAKLEAEKAAASAPAVSVPPPPPPPVAPTASAAPAGAPQPTPPIEETLEVFRRWLLLPDLSPVLAALGCVAANLLPGDPVWLGLVAPPSSAKTEILNSISLLPYVVQAATLTPASLLSGTPSKQQHAKAKGGLLRQIGPFGILMLKDFGSVLSMRPDAKAETLAALREIYDGRWTRHLGTEGGKTLEWEGKVGLVFGSTPVLDSHYGVIGQMGDRFLLCRMQPEPGQLGRAVAHVGAATKHMRKELAEAVTALFAHPRPDPQPLAADEFERLERCVSLVVRLRGAVDRDRHSRELQQVYGAEGTARIGLTLERLLAGLDTLGVSRSVALDVMAAVALDSVPPQRRRAYEFLRDDGKDVPTQRVASVLGLPTTTTRRVLEDLAAYRLVHRTVQGSGRPDLWRWLPA